MPSNDVSNLLCAIEGLSDCDADVSMITNLYEQGDYDVRAFSEEMEVKIDFGNDPYGTFYGLDNSTVSNIACKCSYFVDMSIHQASCLALDCAVRSGCIPILSGTPRHLEFLRSHGLNEEEIDYLTVECSKFRPSNGDCIWMADPEKMRKKVKLIKGLSIRESIVTKLMSVSNSMLTLGQEINKFLKK